MLTNMLCLLPFLHHFPRDRRAAAANVTREAKRACSHVTATRLRRGQKACAKSEWRRTTTGSNHISAYGVWRDQARRSASRLNRTGETRWHRLPVAAASASSARGYKR